MRTPLRSPPYRRSAMKRPCCVQWAPKRRIDMWEVVLGFQFSVVWQRRFDQLPPYGRHLHVAGLGLLLAAFALAVAPATFHRMAEHGHDTPRVLQFASRMIGLALLPFAAALGVSLFVVGEFMGTTFEAAVVGVTGFVCALALWYGWPIWGRHHPSSSGRDRAYSSDTASKIE